MFKTEETYNVFTRCYSVAMYAICHDTKRKNNYITKTLQKITIHYKHQLHKTAHNITWPDWKSTGNKRCSFFFFWMWFSWRRDYM